MWVDEAGESIEGLARRLRQLMLRMGEEAAGRTPVERATERLYEARRLDHDIVEVDAALRQAEDSLRLNPRVREGLLHRVVLRTGLDTLEMQLIDPRGDTKKGAHRSPGANNFRLQRVFNNRNIENLFRDFASIKFFLARDNVREVLVVR